MQQQDNDDVSLLIQAAVSDGSIIIGVNNINITSKIRNNKKRKAIIRDDDNDDGNVNGNDNNVRRHDNDVLLINKNNNSFCSFNEFRLSTINEHPSFIWLGPSSMAVYWFKEYLQTEEQGWIRIPKNHQNQNQQISPKQHQKQRKQSQNSKGNFNFIPGQYLRPDPDGIVYEDNNNNNNNNNIVSSTDDTTTTTTEAAAEVEVEVEAADTTKGTANTTNNNSNISSSSSSSRRIQNILNHGIQDIHYATSYIGVYNLIRSYGRFIRINNNNLNKKSTSNKRRRKEGDEKQQQQNQKQEEEEDNNIDIVVPFDYKGPDLILPKEEAKGDRVM